MATSSASLRFAALLLALTACDARTVPTHIVTARVIQAPSTTVVRYWACVADDSTFDEQVDLVAAFIGCAAPNTSECTIKPYPIDLTTACDDEGTVTLVGGV